MVCYLFKLTKTERNESPFNDKYDEIRLQFNNLNKYSNIKIYLYIHEKKTIPDYLNHYCHIFDTNQRNLLYLEFTKKIIYRHKTSGACIDYGGRFKSKDHCQQMCERNEFDYNYYKFLYFESDNVTIFSSTRQESHESCFENCPSRCIIQHFEIYKPRFFSNYHPNQDILELYM